MARSVRFGRFVFQVRLVLVLLVLFLAALDVMNLFLLGRARSDLERAERARIEAQSWQAAGSVAGEILASAGAEGALPSPTSLRRLALASGFDRIAVLDAAGRERAASGPVLGSPARALEALGPEARTAVLGGHAASGLESAAWERTGSKLWCLVPILDASGRPVALVEVEQSAPVLGRLEGSLRLALAVQIAGVLLIAALVVLFANWVSRPYRRLAVAAGEAGLIGSGAATSDPDELVTAFKRVAGKLREQDEALQSIGREAGGLGNLVHLATGAMRRMTTGVMIVDGRGRVAAMNPAAETLLGRELDKARGREVEEVASGIKGLGRQVRLCLEQGEGAAREVLPRIGQEERPGHVGIAVSPAVGLDADVAGCVVLITDLTEIRQLQEQARLREGLASIGQLAAGIAHECRNGLGTILGYARMLEKRDDPRVRGPAREILKEVDAVRRAVDEFLLYARPPDAQRAAVDLESLVRACAAVTDGVEAEVTGEFGHVLGDEGLLRRVVGNLLQNAAEAGAGLGRPVRVKISGRRVGSDRRVLQLEVEDDGPGIPAERRLQVFQPFFTTKARGTGLGLALVQRTVVELGGSVEVGEGLLGGALFRLRFPTPVEAQRPAGAEGQHRADP